MTIFNIGFLFVLVMVGRAAGAAEPECQGGLWNNLVANLDDMFWEPFLADYSVIRYATQERPLRRHLTDAITNKPVPRSCDDLGVSSFVSVLCVQLAARYRVQWPCSWFASQATQRALATLDECPQETLETEKTLLQGLNRTLQRHQHCAYATKVTRCSLLQLYWVIPTLLGVAAVAGPVLLTVLFAATLAWCCRARDPYQ